MKFPKADTPDVTDATAKQSTGQTLAAWFGVLDAAGGVAQGRRALAQLLLAEKKLDEWWATTLVVEYEKARGALEKDGRPKGYSICSTKTVAAPLGRVFEAFGEARVLGRWLGEGAQVEFREGGALVAEGVHASFTRLRPGKDLRLSWDDARRAPASQVEVQFADKGKGKTGITLNHTRIQSRRDADELRAGWGAALDGLKQCLEGA